jgi:hypothetical protein
MFRRHGRRNIGAGKASHFNAGTMPASAPRARAKSSLLAEFAAAA